MNVEEKRLKSPYEAPMLEVVLTECFDIITSSGGLGGDGDPSWDFDGWT